MKGELWSWAARIWLALEGDMVRGDMCEGVASFSSSRGGSSSSSSMSPEQYSITRSSAVTKTWVDASTDTSQYIIQYVRALRV
jgi:hypothetical protein